MKQWNIAHSQDKYDAKHELDNISYPYRLMAVNHKPDKGTPSYESWLKQNSFFHRGIVPTYSFLSGLGEDEAKKDLQIRFACVREFKEYFEVESVGDMNIPRLAEFIDNCQNFLIIQYGTRADEMLVNNINKTKKVKK